MAAGLHHRAHDLLMTDLLIREREQGLDRTRGAGLTAAREAELIKALHQT